MVFIKKITLNLLDTFNWLECKLNAFISTFSKKNAYVKKRSEIYNVQKKNQTYHLSVEKAKK